MKGIKLIISVIIAISAVFFFVAQNKKGDAKDDAQKKYESNRRLENQTLVLEDFEELIPGSWSITYDVLENRNPFLPYDARLRPLPYMTLRSGGPDKLTLIYRVIADKYRKTFLERKEDDGSAQKKGESDREFQKRDEAGTREKELKFEKELTDAYSSDNMFKESYQELYAYNNKTLQWFGGKQITALQGTPNFKSNYLSTLVLGVRVYFASKGYDEVYIYPNREKGITIKGITKSISVWALGRNYPHELYVDIEDYQGLTHRFPMTWNNELLKADTDEAEKVRLREIKADKDVAMAQVEKEIKEAKDNGRDTRQLEAEQARIKKYFDDLPKLDNRLGFGGWKRMTAYIPRFGYNYRLYYPLNKDKPLKDKDGNVTKILRLPRWEEKRRSYPRAADQKVTLGSEIRPIRIVRLVIRQNPKALLGAYYLYLDHLTAVSDINKLTYDGGDIKDHW